MASSGPNSPTTVVSSDEIEAGGLTWTNPGNAVSSNNTYASMAGVTDETIEDYLKATGFGFSIPDGTIDGIVVEIDGRAVGGDTTACNTSAALVINGLINANYAKPGATWVPDAGESTLTFGTSSDDWDGGVATQLTPADINDADFGVAFTANTANAATTFEVDHIRITVHYTPAASGPGVHLRAGMTMLGLG